MVRQHEIMVYIEKKKRKKKVTFYNTLLEDDYSHLILSCL